MTTAAEPLGRSNLFPTDPIPHPDTSSDCCKVSNCAINAIKIIGLTLLLGASICFVASLKIPGIALLIAGAAMIVLGFILKPEESQSLPVEDLSAPISESESPLLQGYKNIAQSMESLRYLQGYVRIKHAELQKNYSPFTNAPKERLPDWPYQFTDLLKAIELFLQRGNLDEKIICSGEYGTDLSGSPEPIYTYSVAQKRHLAGEPPSVLVSSVRQIFETVINQKEGTQNIMPECRIKPVLAAIEEKADELKSQGLSKILEHVNKVRELLSLLEHVFKDKEHGELP